MARRGFFKDKGPEIDFSQLDPGLSPAGEIKSKSAVFLGNAFSIIKFVLGICLLPFVYSGLVAFYNEFGLIEKALQNSFWSGIISFLVIYLFIWEPAKIYTKGHRILEWVFSFFKPLVRVAPYVLPIYTIILFIFYWLLSYLFKDITQYFIFLFGFSIALHLVFSAKSIRSRRGDLLKANYIFGFSLVLIINLILLALCLNLIFEKFSFVNFFNNSFQIAKSIFG
ncbi:MAG: hypothetical protein HZA27_04415, partial [Candidatus Omnitrophica bacterium]|nr:hypothetical protein [Candidatus Omnitrophota bacterium]